MSTQTSPLVAASCPDNPTTIAKALNQLAQTQVASASGAINITSGFVFITDASAAALTLAAPVAGAPSAGGNDGQELVIMSTTAQAHTVTTPSNGINGSKHVATYGAAVANVLILVAYNGVWYVEAETGITLT